MSTLARQWFMRQTPTRIILSRRRSRDGSFTHPANCPVPKTALTVLVLALTVAACTQSESDTFADSAGSAEAVITAAQAIDSTQLLSRINDLAADSMEGRAPGTPGEEKTVAYLTSAFQALGL